MCCICHQLLLNVLFSVYAFVTNSVDPSEYYSLFFFFCLSSDLHEHMLYLPLHSKLMHNTSFKCLQTLTVVHSSWSSSVVTSDKCVKIMTGSFEAGPLFSISSAEICFSFYNEAFCWATIQEVVDSKAKSNTRYISKCEKDDSLWKTAMGCFNLEQHEHGRQRPDNDLSCSL